MFSVLVSPTWQISCLTPLFDILQTSRLIVPCFRLRAVDLVKKYYDTKWVKVLETS